MTVVMKSSASAMAPNPLRQLLIGDLLAAGLSSLAVTPAVAIIDKGVVSAASGIAPSVIASILASIGSMVRSPLKFVQSPEFMWIWAVYFLTYLVANSIATLCESREIKAASPVFLGTTAANLGMCISKDAAFAKIFGTGPPRPLPLLTYLLFVLRDGGTVSASFTLPSKVSARLQQRGWSSTLADNVAQLSCPMLVQILSTNLHLYGLDL